MSGGPDRLALVTGGCGFLGQHLVSVLLDSGWRVRVLDDLSVGRPNLPAGAELVVGSVLDRVVTRRAAHRADLVLHLAGIVGMRLAAASATLAYDVAAEGTRTVLEASGDADVVLFSSSAVYGIDGGIMREDRSIPRDVPLAYDGGAAGYATGKWEMEQLGLAESAAGRRVLIVRPFNVVGVGQVSTYGMVVPTFVESALAGRPLTVYGTGDQRRCFSEVGEFCRSVALLMWTGVAWVHGDNVVNVGSSEEVPIGRLARLVLAETGSRSPVERIPYDQVFPGRTDVVRRVPGTDRLHGYVAIRRWPGITEIVRRVVEEARGSAGGGGSGRDQTPGEKVEGAATR